MNATDRAPRTKQEYYRRWLRGELGNYWPSYGSVDEALRAGRQGKGVLAVRAKVPGFNTRFDLGEREARQVEAELRARRIPASVSYMTKDDKAHLQGEVRRVPGGLELYYSTARGQNIKAALRESGQHAYGLEARSILQWGLDAGSYEDVIDLLDRYPDAVIEFSAYEIHQGAMPHRNTIIWEVREY